MRVLAALLLLLPAFPVAEAASCPVTTNESRTQAGYWVVVDERLCTERTSGRHAVSVRVTQGPPSDNRSPVLLLVLYEHDRLGDRSSGHTVREHVQARSEANGVDVWYNSTRDAAGYTQCSLYANATHPRGNLTARHVLAACVPQELLQP